MAEIFQGIASHVQLNLVINFKLTLTGRSRAPQTPKKSAHRGAHDGQQLPGEDLPRNALQNALVAAGLLGDVHGVGHVQELHVDLEKGGAGKLMHKTGLCTRSECLEVLST